MQVPHVPCPLPKEQAARCPWEEPVMAAPEAWHVTRTMRTLEMLALRPRSAVDVANALGVHPRTARRLLNRLLVEGYATRTGPHRRQYGMTLKLVAVAGRATAVR
jgi:DNA-binding IclR family transcriptional regulator